MNKILGLFVAGLLILTGSAQAHCGKCGMGDASAAVKEDVMGKKMDKMVKELKLTDEQKGPFEAIMKEKMEKKQQIMAQKEEAMDALHNDVKAKLTNVLSEEQMKKWESIKGHCPMCKDGKMCEMCLLKKGSMKGHCPDCKDGKMCEACMRMKGMKN